MSDDRPSIEERPFFATAAKGTEGALRDELRDMRVAKIRATRGGVYFGGDQGHAMRACLRSRVASRILCAVGEFYAPDGDALYEGVSAIDWAQWLGAERTLGVAATVKSGDLTHSGFVAQRTKDAVVDQLRDREGDRPDVERSDPDLRITVHIDHNLARIYVDYSGTPLPKRGYRTNVVEAPLRENLAAAMLRLSGYQPGTFLLDPMCGSGTIAIEAAMWSAGIAPGAQRRFGFERWRSFDDTAKESWRVENQRAERFAEAVESDTYASDNDKAALVAASANAKRAGVDIACAHVDLKELDPAPPGSWVITNPPYGVRLERDRDWVKYFRRALDVLRDSTVVVITPDRDLPHMLKIKPDGEHTLYNGNIECRMYTWKPC
jgi:putative N6-adenine-specific DNA methylase